MDNRDVSDAAGERLAATGSRHPGWLRLPEEPPFDPKPTGVADPRYAPVDSVYVSDPDLTQPTRSLAPTSPSPSRRGGRGVGWAQTVVAATIGAVIALVGMQLVQTDNNDAAVPTAAEALATPGETGAIEVPSVVEPRVQILPEATTNAAAIGDAVIPSIVTVQVSNTATGSAGPSSSGSGVIIDETGLIVTNDHVVAPGDIYEVVLSDGRTTYPAELIGTDSVTDLAVLRINAPGLRAIELGETTTLRVGDRAVAVGSPLGLDGGPSLTVGVVSAFDRKVQVSATDILYGMVQTDAPITQGSSGGALVDSQGRLIGITTAVGVSEVGIEGIGFATPVELVRRVVTDLIDNGEVRHAFIGITGGTRFEESPDGASVAVGVEIENVEASSAASAAGLSAGDIITALDGEAITTMEDLIAALRFLGEGDGISLTIDNGESTVTRPVTLGLRTVGG